MLENYSKLKAFCLNKLSKEYFLINIFIMTPEAIHIRYLYFKGINRKSPN
jgi:hypothetical protein